MSRVALRSAWVLLAAVLGCHSEATELEMPAEPMRTPARTARAASRSPIATVAEGDAGVEAMAPVSSPMPSVPRGSPEPSASPQPSALPATAGDSAAVAAMVEAWRSAWQAKDLQAYLDHYAAEFQADGMDRAAWAVYKEKVFGRAGAIEVRIEGLRIQVVGEGAEVGFRQRYASGSYRDSGDKRLDLRQIDGRWRIVGEVFRAARR